jgi:hypothetical protein
MKKTGLVYLLGLLLVLPLWPGSARAAQVTVSLTNLTQAIWFTPFLITAHGGETFLFRVGQPAGPELQAMAEGGDISGLSGLLGGADADTIENPAGGLLGPGQTVTATLNTDSSGNPFLSLTAMLLPTNDSFVGLDSLQLSLGVQTRYLYAYDAGTEANNELINLESGGVPGTPGIPADPSGLAGSGGTGLTDLETNPTVHIHRGNVGDADPAGGPSDLSESAHRWLNPVAVATITVN